MKALVKCKKGICLVHTGGGYYLDEHRFRVVPYDLEISRWDSRGLVEIKTSSLKDEANDFEFKALLNEKGDSAVSEFISKYSNAAKQKKAEENQRKTEEKQKKEPVKVEEAPVQEQVEEAPVQEQVVEKPIQKREYVKSYKKRG